MDVDLSVPHRLGVALALVIGAALLGTAVVLAFVLPDATVAAHWSLAWSGLDVATATTALMTAVLLLRRDRRAALAAGAGAALLVLDAWFDVTTAVTATQLLLAVGEAVVLELPLAVLAARFALRWLHEPTTRVSSPLDVRPGPRLEDREACLLTE